MESRKIQQTGGSTYIISLPKQWADHVGIKPGMRVGVQPQPDGTLLISPDVEQKNPVRKKIDVTDLEGAALEREIIAAYLFGYDFIEFFSERISAGQKKVIRTVCYKLMGTEIIEETSNSVVIQDLLNPRDMSIKKAIHRMFLISLSMFRDSIRSLKNRDIDLATDVTQRDNEVDRLFLVIAKQFRQILFGADFLSASQTSIQEYHDLRMAATPIERIADHSQKIAKVVILKNPAYDAKTLDEIRIMAEMAEEIASESIDALFSADSISANKAIVKMNMLNDFVSKFKDNHFKNGTKSKDLVSLQTVVDSITRIADYSVNISEIAINASIEER